MNKINIVAFIKNEELLIDHFLNYHKKIVDNIYIIDHSSTDSTPKILSTHDIYLTTYSGDFDNKGKICTQIINSMDADIVVPLDADECIIYDDGLVVSDDVKLIRSYLQNIPINQCIYNIRQVYNQLTDTCYYTDNRLQLYPKVILPIKYVSSVSCGFHDASLINCDEQPSPTRINISYVHYHNRYKQYWIDSCEKKLKARIGKDISNNLDDIKKLANSKNKSFHVAQEYLSYLNTGKWRELPCNTNLFLPSLMNVIPYPHRNNTAIDR